VEIVENIIDDNDFMEVEEEQPFETTDTETEPEDAGYVDNTVENETSPDSVEEPIEEDTTLGAENYFEPGEEEELIEEEPITEDQMDMVNDNQSFEGYTIEERNNKRPIILAVGTPRNPFHIYAYEQYN